MARRDLEDLREAIVALAGLTDSEARVIKYWGEDRLLETFALLPEDGIAESESDEQDEQDEQDVRDEMARFDHGEDYDDDPFYDDEGYWEVEATFDYGENT
jgi:hypothetical protein